MNEEEKEIVTNEAQYDEIKDFIRQVNDEGRGIDNFFLEIIRTDNSKKVGNLTEDELGLPKLPIRTLSELENDCNLIPSMSSFAKHFKKHSEDILATSLSKDGFLIKARITQKKELLGNDKQKQKRRGLFGKKEESEK